MDRLVSELQHQARQAGTSPDDHVAVQPFFQEGNTTQGYVDLLMKQQKIRSVSEKQVFIAGVNTLIGHSVINDSLKKERAASSSPPAKRTAGNKDSIERSEEIKRLVDTLREAGHNVSHKDMKLKLAMGDLWRLSIEPYSKGVWRVLPIYEFFDTVGFNCSGQASPGRIPRAYIRVLFRCIQDTKDLYGYLVNACSDVNGFVDRNLRDETGWLTIHGNDYVESTEVDIRS